MTQPCKQLLRDSFERQPERFKGQRMSVDKIETDQLKFSQNNDWRDVPEVGGKVFRFIDLANRNPPLNPGHRVQHLLG
jgi:hypothetical protein